MFPDCGAGSFKKRDRCNHIHRCRKIRTAKLLGVLQSEVKFCYFCMEFFRADECQEHCRRHLSTAKRYARLVGDTVINVRCGITTGRTLYLRRSTDARCGATSRQNSWRSHRRTLRWRCFGYQRGTFWSYRCTYRKRSNASATVPQFGFVSGSWLSAICLDEVCGQTGHDPYCCHQSHTQRAQITAPL